MFFCIDYVSRVSEVLVFSCLMVNFDAAFC